MKKRIISTPKKWYIIGLIILLICLICWIIFAVFDNVTCSIISDISKNSFFAIAGSLFVSFLIDVGNTSRDYENQKNAFLQLKSNIDSVYYIISGISFVLKECVICDKEGKVTLKNYYNKEFYYKDSDVIAYTTLDDISDFKNRVDPALKSIIQSHSFVNLDSKLGEALEKLLVEKFGCICLLRENVIENGIGLMGLNNDILMLENIVKTLGDFLNKTNRYEMLPEEQANKHHKYRIEFRKQHSQELKFINEIMKK